MQITESRRGRICSTFALWCRERSDYSLTAVVATLESRPAHCSCIRDPAAAGSERAVHPRRSPARRGSAHICRPPATQPSSTPASSNTGIQHTVRDGLPWRAAARLSRQRADPCANSAMANSATALGRDDGDRRILSIRIPPHEHRPPIADTVTWRLLFARISVRHQRRSMLMTANQPSGEWNKIFQDSAMTLAATDRLIHHATILEMR